MAKLNPKAERDGRHLKLCQQQHVTIWILKPDRRRTAGCMPYREANDPKVWLIAEKNAG